MSEDFGKSVMHPVHDPVKEMEDGYPEFDHLQNKEYDRLIKNYVRCVHSYLAEFMEAP